MANFAKLTINGVAKSTAILFLGLGVWLVAGTPESAAREIGDSFLRRATSSRPLADDDFLPSRMPRGFDEFDDGSNFDFEDRSFDRARERVLPRSRFEDDFPAPRSERLPARNRYRDDRDADMDLDQQFERGFDRLNRNGREEAPSSRPHRTSRPRYDLDDQQFDRDLPSPRTNKPRRPLNRMPIEPVAPTAPRHTTTELSLDEKITRRYQDERVIRVLTQLTAQSGQNFFLEVSQMIDSRHIEPTSYAQRIDNGFEHLMTALANPAFQTAAGIRPSRGDIQQLQGQFAAMFRQSAINTQSDAVNAIRQTAQVCQQTIGLNPGVVYFEFVYASMESLDKYSMILPPEKSGEVSVGLKSNMVGIGVEVEPNPAGLRILKAFNGGPAAEATLRKGDIITAADGRPLAGLEMDQAVQSVTGAAGSSVQLSLRRDNMVADVTLVRRAVAITSVSEVRMLDEAPGVGYIKLDQFAETSAKELDAGLWQLHNSGMETLILDLRGNPGGYLTTAIELCDRFLPSGTIVSTRGRTPDDNSQETANYAETWKTPLVVLIDHNSASASEIFAAAIQENGRGLIVGETSYGKGTVQTLFSLRSVTAGLRLTTAKFYSPDGREMAGAGVTPDIRVPTGSGDEDALMLQAATQATRDPRLQGMSEGIARTGLRIIKVASTMPETSSIK